LIGAQLAEGAVGLGVGDSPEGRAGEEAILRVAREGEGPRLSEEAVGIVPEGEPGRLVEAVTNALSNPLRLQCLR
jgi:hypothetical protein